MIEIKYLKDKPELIDKISDINYNLWNEFYSDGKDDEINNLEDYKNYVKNNYLNTDKIPIYLIALDDDRYIGSITITNDDFPDLPRDKKWLTELYVIPEYRNKGIGKLLIKKAKEVCNSLNFEGVYLSCLEELIFYYKKLGFHFIDKYIFSNKTYYIFYTTI